MEWFCAAVVVAAGSTLFGHFEEGTPKVRCLSRWVGYLGMVALLSRTVRGPGPSPTSSACLLSALSSTSSGVCGTASTRSLRSPRMSTTG